MGKTTILGVDFDTYTLDEAAEHAVNLMNESGQHIVCTPNPEIVMEAQHDRELMGISVSYTHLDVYKRQA